MGSSRRWHQPGAPFDIVLPLTVANGSISDGATTITIPKGSVESGTLTVTRTTGTTAAVTVDIGTLPGLPSGHTGYALVKSTTDLPLTVINSNSAPVFTEGTSATRSVAENTASGTNIGSAVAATDADTGDTLTYSLGGTDAAAFSIVSTSGQLQTSAALDYETKSSYTVTVSVSDGNSGTDSITVTINITNVNEAPVFSEGSSTTRSIAENTAAGTNIGTAVAATDVDTGTTLTYTLGGTDAASFSIVSTSGQLQTKAALDYETKTSYSVTITVSDGSLTDSITVTINVTDVSDTNNAPVFTDGTSTTRSVAENTASGQNIGTAVAATDADNDTLTYTLGGTDAASFSIVSTSGQLQTKAALDYETKSSYTVTVSVSDGNGGSDRITVTINVTDVPEDPSTPNNPPAFGPVSISSISATVGTPIAPQILPAATDADAGDTITYSLTPAPPAGVTYHTVTRLLMGTPTAVMAATVYTYTASDGTDTATLTFIIEVEAAPPNAPTFGGQAIDTVSATVGTAITPQILPASDRC